MEFLESTYTLLTMALLAVILGALYVVRLMTAAERRMITGSAFFLAGLFFIGRHPGDILISGIGAGLWAFGLWLFLRAGLGYSRRSNRAPAWVAVIVLPIALFGALLAGGILVTLLAPPAEAAMALVGR